MTSLFGVLGVGANGLRTAAFGSAVASENIGGAATPGYTRRIVNIEPIAPGHLGSRATGSTRIADSFLERRMLGASSFEGEAKARHQALGVLDAVFADGPGDIANSLDAFQRALGDAMSRPNDPAARSIVLERAHDLASSFQRSAEALDNARVDVNGRISDTVRQVNGKLSEIASLGTQIARDEAAGGQAADLRDRRDQLVREVSEALPVTRIDNADGSIELLLAGSRSLVSGDGRAIELEAVTDATSGDVRLRRVTAGAPEDVTNLVTTGSIGGLIDARDGAIADARGALDQLASDIATAYNGVHSAHVGLDGASGRNLFEPPAAVDGAARAMALSSDVRGQPSNLALAEDPAALPGDNRGALALLAVADTKIALGGTSNASDAYASILANAGAAVQGARNVEEHATAAASQITSLRESISGVSTDEEMISLMKFQRAYQASLRVIEVADSMLGELMSLRR